jgi:putative endonuclease
MKSHKIKSYRFGLWAEYWAIIFLIFKGYKILKLRYKTKLGEIDLIAKKAGHFIAIEVKARKGFTTPDEVLSDYQKLRIKRAMEIFLSGQNDSKRGIKNYGLKDYGVKFDLIIIRPFALSQHFKQFWE